ncbi:MULTISPECIES: OmpA family protein [Oleiagrimonas]|uniref:OmpA family protein n=1 Tax=Oleiagrimonas citrea TaxID=1665687 RepID=A0A846ZHZ0_9GAMM|nr:MULTISPECIES: OmpA family protein [Oleiagrimonas]NKZ37407.1 OmpA family protein [Oleiagrimonas citrea]RAP57912.1 hypothetical protein BTJ49_08615 [Oleiagrimonas sp. MCCC 1A03011]
MMFKNYKSLCMAVAVATLALGGCTNYVKKTDFDAAIQRLQAKDQDLQQQITSLSQDMQQKLAQYDTRITAMEGRISVDTVAHFDFNKSDLKDSDKAMLDQFAKVMNAHHSDAVVTVEGFTDPAGSAAYNKKLGMKRAEAVRNYLVNDAGMNADQVRAVSYGEATNRQVEPGKTHDAGSNNRRVSLVIDFAGSQTS